IQEYNEVKYSNELSKDSLSKFALDFIQKNSKSLAIFVALNDVKDIKKALTFAEKGIGQSYANSNYHKSLQAGLQQVAKSEQAKKSSKTRMGAVAPELNMVNPEGKIMTLESLRGKYVLIDFWASWCGPCRRENPTVVRLYNKYKDQGFDVYSVSLDKSKSKWVSAIAKDKLSWPNHVSDLKGWGSAATRLYGFRGIPYTVLIDREGKIIGTRLRGPALERKLEELFK
ncbi:MAG: TlpA disulfide reductase family protein, partial [Flavobacteriales bacterium]